MRTSLLLNSLVILLIVGTSCKRLDGETVVEGQVVDKYTGKAVPDAIVGVYSVSSNSFSGGFNHKDLEKQADGKGKFSFRFESDDSREYALIASKGNSYDINWADPLILEEGRNNKKLKVKMQPLAWVRVKLVNVPPLDMASKIGLAGYADMINGQDFTSLYNYNRDTVFVRKVKGNSETIFLCEITALNGQLTKSNPTAYFPAFDTTDLVINY